MMYIYLIFLFISVPITCNSSCSREDSRLVRDYFLQALGPIYEKNHLTIPSECICSPSRDYLSEQEFHKSRLTKEIWLCQYCNKTFSSEYYLDNHLSHRHKDTLAPNEHSVCLADYCSIFRCDALKTLSRTSTKSVHEEQLTILRSRCASIINQCIPQDINHDMRVNLQHAMYAEICAYLTRNKYFELPNYRKSLVNLTSVFSFTILLGICFIIVVIRRHFHWQFNDHEDDESSKHLSDETISSATALLSKMPTTGIIHSIKSPPTAVRHRVRFKSREDSPHSHGEHC